MPRTRHLSRWHWVILAAALTFAAVSVANLLFGWDNEWITAALPVVGIATSIYTFRLLWKRSDHPAFHPKKRPSDTNDRDD